MSPRGGCARKYSWTTECVGVSELDGKYAIIGRVTVGMAGSLVGSGPDEDLAMQAVTQLIAGRFEEEE